MVTLVYRLLINPIRRVIEDARAGDVLLVPQWKRAFRSERPKVQWLTTYRRRDKLRFTAEGGPYVGIDANKGLECWRKDEPGEGFMARREIAEAKK